MILWSLNQNITAFAVRSSIPGITSGGTNMKRVKDRNMMPNRSSTKIAEYHRNEYRGAIRMCRSLLMGTYGFSCSICHKDVNDLGAEVFEFAHVHGKPTMISGRGRGSYARLKDVFDHPDSYILLCHDHHLEYDKTK